MGTLFNGAVESPWRREGEGEGVHSEYWDVRIA